MTMSSQPTHTKAEEVRYQKLSAIDSKCGSLLQLTSVLLVFISMPPIFDAVRPKHALAFKAIFVGLLLSCLLSLGVLFFKEHTSERFVDVRKYALNFSLCVTGVCCAAVTFIVIVSL